MSSSAVSKPVATPKMGDVSEESKSSSLGESIEAMMEARLTMPDGNTMSAVGLGTWKSSKGKTGEAVKTAIRAGYRHIDCANDYFNEPEIGQAIAELIAEGTVTREELFITAKLWNTNHRAEHVRLDLEKTLKDLQVAYVDAYLIHWPQAFKGPALALDGGKKMFPVDAEGYYEIEKDVRIMETWHAMEDLADEGLCRSLGGSNFNIDQIKQITKETRKYPFCLNQCERHPYFQQKELIDYCQSQGIIFEAFSPLGSGDRPWAKPDDPALLEDPKLAKIAAKHKKTIAQVILRWHVESGISLVPKSVTPSRIVANADVFDFKLDDDDMKEIETLEIPWRHLTWHECAGHPDYPFHSEVPKGYVIGRAEQGGQDV